ncbi:MAG: hypothetical protein HYZ74_02975, partial [Elusimicrobia bacterium]|nr:hypothetical protein [Elusimicrobiota bacterium]
VRLKWHYGRHGKTLTSIRDEAARARLLAEATELIAKIKHDHAFEPAPGPLCDWCEYRDLCPVFAHPEKVAAMPPFERREDDGVRLVESFAEIEARRRRLKDELKVVERERDDVERRLADWAEAAGVTTVAGERAQAGITIKEDIHLPTKTGEPDRHAELDEEAKASPLWGDISRLDAHALVEGARSRRWGGELLALAESLLARYGRKVTTRTVRLKRRAGLDEE